MPSVVSHFYQSNVRKLDKLITHNNLIQILVFLTGKGKVYDNSNSDWRTTLRDETQEKFTRFNLLTVQLFLQVDYIKLCNVYRSKQSISKFWSWIGRGYSGLNCQVGLGSAFGSWTRPSKCKRQQGNYALHALASQSSNIRSTRVHSLRIIFNWYNKLLKS